MDVAGEGQGASGVGEHQAAGVASSVGASGVGHGEAHEVASTEDEADQEAHHGGGAVSAVGAVGAVVSVAVASEVHRTCMRSVLVVFSRSHIFVLCADCRGANSSKYFYNGYHCERW